MLGHTPERHPTNGTGIPYNAEFFWREDGQPTHHDFGLRYGIWGCGGNHTYRVPQPIVLLELSSRETATLDGHIPPCRNENGRMTMLPLARPALFPNGQGTYNCPDIRTLYQWLEAHEYHYYGSFGPHEYGRFACQELELGDTGPTHLSSLIEVHMNGVVVAADERAKQLLEELVSRVRFL
jgi:hypothetical protein